MKEQAGRPEHERKLPLYPDNPIFDYNGEELTLVKLIAKRVILGARVKKAGGSVDIRYRKVMVTKLPIQTLKDINIWDDLSDSVKEIVTKADEDNRNAGRAKMAHARSKRRNKYEGIPRSIKCSECDEPKDIAPAQIIKRADKAGRSIENWIKEFKCQSCCPTKGRKANPAFANLPKELVCKCGNRVNTSGSAIVGAAGRKKITPEEYVKQYECQSCNPTRGRNKKK